MLRTEALQVADQLKPEGFHFNSLVLTDRGTWVATFIDDSKPPQGVVERWHDVYTEGDPDPEETENTGEDE